jgi:hypothetical protein
MLIFEPTKVDESYLKNYELRIFDPHHGAVMKKGEFVFNDQCNVIYYPSTANTEEELIKELEDAEREHEELSRYNEE